MRMTGKIWDKLQVGIQSATEDLVESYDDAEHGSTSEAIYYVGATLLEVMGLFVAAARANDI